MTEPEIKRFTAALQADPTLRSEALALAGDLDALVDWTQAHGFALTREDLQALMSGELSDDELEQAAGGEDPWGGTGAPLPS